MNGRVIATLLAALAPGMAQAEGIETAYRKLASEINATLPTTVDKDTRADNVTLGPGLVFTYNFTITSKRASEFDPAAFLAKARPVITAGACSNPDMKQMFRDNVNLRYSYRGADGAFIGRFDISPSDCGFGR